ncbi:MAG TPA: aldo/keto reductase, partial [Acidimicrobiales bacterium]|nr:aldo/keto reductase [Acidimicrobiales bacterium]
VGTALDLGINAYDTADAYNGGRSEEVLGKALRSRRGQVVLSTKVGLRVGDTEADLAAAFRPGGLDHAERWQRGIAPTEHGLSRKHVIAALDDSLRRLGTDYVDLYQVHRWDDEAPIEETLAALDTLVRAGKVRYVGCSGFAAWQLVRALWAADRTGTTAPVSIQAPYNIVNRSIEADLLPACTEQGVGVLAFQVLAGGILTARFDRTRDPDGSTRVGSRGVYRMRYWNDGVFDAVDRMREVAERTGRQPSHLALGWALARPAVTAVLFGVSRPEQLTDVAPVLDKPLDAGELAELDPVATGAR